jgi:plasmid rolling circle replication initiator protein Rep
LKLAKILMELGYHKLAERVYQCAKYPLFTVRDEKLKLLSVRFCRVRQCPICQWRRSLMWVAKFCVAYPKIEEDYPTSRFLFLTITVKNCPSGDLKATLNHLNHSFARLTQRKEWPAQGWVKSVEITRSEDDLAHPHIHALIMAVSFLPTN